MRIKSLLVVLAVFSGALALPRDAEAFVRHTLDDQELLDVRAASPAAADAFARAEARLRAGDLAGADAQLVKAREVSPHSPLLARRHCQVLTELGKREAAITACTAAMAGQTAMDSRAYVGALMSGPKLATPKALVDAAREAANARRLVGQPFADVALCEIAHHIGDQAMYTRCLAGLQQSAPDYFETARWRAARPGTPVWFYWLGWSVLAAIGALTLGQAFLRWFRKPAPRVTKAGTTAAAVIALSVSLAHPAHAQEAAPTAPSAPTAPTATVQPVQHPQLSHFVINFDDPESQIPTIAERNADPLEFGYFLQDLSAEALKAERASDFRKALKFWRASAKAVPDEAVGFSRACRAYQALEERENALPLCARAMNLHGATAEDYLRFSELMVATPVALKAEEIRDLDAAIAHLRTQPESAGPAAVMECRLAVKEEDEARLANCTAVLAKTAPGDPHTLTFQWSLAMKRRDYGEARRLLTAMATTKMLPTAQAELRAATDKAATWWRRPFTDPRYGFGLLAVMGLGAVLVMRKRSQLRDAPPGAAPAA